MLLGLCDLVIISMSLMSLQSPFFISDLTDPELSDRCKLFSRCSLSFSILRVLCPMSEQSENSHVMSDRSTPNSARSACKFEGLLQYHGEGLLKVSPRN